MNKVNEEFLNNFINYLRVEKRFSENTLIAYKNDIEDFVSFIEEEGLGDINEIIPSIAQEYVNILFNEKDYNTNTALRKISAINSMYVYFTQSRKDIELNPFQDVDLKKREKKQPKTLTENEFEEFFKSIDDSSSKGKRDKLIFSLLYGSGLRVSELTSLKLKDVNASDRVIKIHGKGSKDRLVPMSTESQELYRTYLNESRPYLLARATDMDNDYVFLNFKGGVLTSRGVRDILEKQIESASLILKVSPHSFRHSFATHLVNKGMDIRMVQELLGHSNLSTTQIYTELANEKMLEEYNKAFPKGDKK